MTASASRHRPNLRRSLVRNLATVVFFLLFVCCCFWSCSDAAGTARPTTIGAGVGDGVAADKTTTASMPPTPTSHHRCFDSGQPYNHNHHRSNSGFSSSNHVGLQEPQQQQPNIEVTDDHHRTADGDVITVSNITSEPCSDVLGHQNHQPNHTGHRPAESEAITLTNSSVAVIAVRRRKVYGLFYLHHISSN